MYTNNIKVGIVGISHTYTSIIKALEKYNYEILICDIDEEKIKDKQYPKYTNYKELDNKIDIAFIATPPSSHYEIALHFLKKGIKVICEKPLVTNINDLNELTKYNDLYNILHFSYGEEIEWFINNYNIQELPEKIICNINDPYINNKKIMEEKLSLHGSYLDESINPLSAIYRIYRTQITFLSNKKYTYQDDIYDYKSNSIFKMDKTTIYINTNWNDYNNKEKYIDLIYKDKAIRLDSYNIKVVDISNNKELFKSINNRMDYHYENGLKDIHNNKEDFYLLNKVILEGEENAENNIY